MPEPENSNPNETFGFVDKRRVTEPSGDTQIKDAETAESEIIESEQNEAPDKPEEQPAGSHPSIYDVAGYCTGLLITEGFQRLGLIADTSTGKAVMDLPSARVAIDCVAALVGVLDEPGSTLPEPVRREMKRTLNDLRLNYVDRTRS